MSAMNPESSIPRGHEPGPADGNFSSQASDVLRTGDQIAGCLIIRPLGRGINGAVYHAQQLAEEREVALRVLSRRVPQTDFVLQQGYVRESGASAWMTHPNIVRVHGAVTEGDRRCLIMDYVDGQSLEDRLAPGEPLPLEVCLRFFEGVCSGLARAHAAGVVHQDVKPRNIAIGAGESVKLMDFGFSRPGGDKALTSAGLPRRTAECTSPEVCKGDDPDFRSDIYSVGATFYHALTGRPMFPGETFMTVMVKQMTDEPVHLKQLRPDLPTGLIVVVMRMLQKAPAHRPQTMDEVLGEVRRIRSACEAGPGRDVEANKSSTVVEEKRLPPARILGLTDGLTGRKFPLRPEGITTIGRRPTNDLSILHETVSRDEHCTIEARDGTFILRDRKSLNGCMINMKPVTEGELSSGDTLAIGHAVFQFRVLPATEDAYDLAKILVKLGAFTRAEAERILRELAAEWYRGSLESLGQLLLRTEKVKPEQLERAQETLNRMARKQAAQMGQEPLPRDGQDPERRGAEAQAGGPALERVEAAHGRAGDGPGGMIPTNSPQLLPGSIGPESAPPSPSEAEPRALETVESSRTQEAPAAPKLPVTAGNQFEDGPEEPADPSPHGPPGMKPCCQCGDPVLPADVRRGMARHTADGPLCGACISGQH